MSQRQEQKDVALAYALWCLSLVGLCGVQRLYLGQVGYGLILLLTFGFCGVAQLLDLILLPDAVGQLNRANAIRALAPRPSATPVSSQVMLTGADLLAKVKELGDVGKSEIVRSCGYVSTTRDGAERLNFTSFYVALMEAKGVSSSQGSLPTPPVAPAPPASPKQPPASTPAARGAQDDDLDSLLREAQRSIERTDQRAEP